MSIDFLPGSVGRNVSPATKNDLDFLQLTLHGIGYMNGKPWSKWPARKVFAVAEREGLVLAMGFNGLPPEYDDADPAYRVKPKKREHGRCAEACCCDNAQAVGVSLVGATMHLPWFPCKSCATRLVAEGIETVVVLVEPEDFMPKCDWSAGFVKACEIMSEAGVKIRVFDSRNYGLSGLMKRKEDTAAVPSGSTDWNRRYLKLSAFLEEGWRRGEVIAKAPLRAGDTHEKIVRAISLEGAINSGVSIPGCTLFTATLPSLERLRHMVLRGIAKVVMGQEMDANANMIAERLSIPIETLLEVPLHTFGHKPAGTVLASP
jgi:deoxycytidylate deaminase